MMEILGWILLCFIMSVEAKNIPVVINTWEFTVATKAAWNAVYNEGRSALDAVEIGCTACEVAQCDGTVGYGGSPDESGETTLDAMIMDGPSHDIGAVGALRRVKSAISVARRVLENTQHSILVGDQATEFAKQMGFKEEDLSTNKSRDMWKKWKLSNCQPNYWKNVVPDPKKSCGPYRPAPMDGRSNEIPQHESNFDYGNHDTIGMLVIDSQNRMAGGTSTNGEKFKIPGRVGDSPLVGAGLYVDQEVGGAAATGDGDVMMRFLPSYRAVENMAGGMNPYDAAADAIKRIGKKYPTFSGAVITVNINGEVGAACHGMKVFPFSVCNPVLQNVTVKTVSCI
ncbi:N(4)-(Beta-N-acetylglucosaminyl)-L-asparaginase [Centruroides vittatus]|uniref:N(4)-(Beta-N-acetylglucosaminyl)-L-asparaginase n=1 Tax=Centruroides vittatus TaxID=120091 RepID=UPI00350F3C70